MTAWKDEVQRAFVRTLDELEGDALSKEGLDKLMDALRRCAKVADQRRRRSLVVEFTNELTSAPILRRILSAEQFGYEAWNDIMQDIKDETPLIARKQEGVDLEAGTTTHFDQLFIRTTKSDEQLLSELSGLAERADFHPQSVGRM